MTSAVAEAVEDGLPRCPWAVGNPALRAYHDTEWGVPIQGESAWFERLTLEAFQSGLSWLTILNKREAFRAAFVGFDADVVAAYDDRDRARLMADAGIVRNRAKINAAITNAGAVIDLRSSGGLEEFIAGHRPDREVEPQAQTTSPESVALSKALKKAGFVFVGPTTMYALMEATGMFDPHLPDCFRRGLSAA